ncbi:MAG: hypothetical protein JSW00_18340 [Thermoplasmata archaeon]|nr:MAG: hypothetical protein JSW00_18340 [Thermoplasmata archaeon]
MNDSEKKQDTIPAINVYKGLPMIKGKEGYEPMEDSEREYIKIEDLMDKLKEDFKRVFIVDLNGINRDKPQLELIKRLSTKMELWVDGGSRYAEGAIDILIAGSEKVVLGTKTLRSIEELDKACELSQNIVLGIDYDKGIVSPKKKIREMSARQLANEAKDIGIEDLIFSDLAHIATEDYFSLDVGKTLLDSEMNIYFHGRFESGLERFKGMNLAGLVVEVETLI